MTVYLGKGDRRDWDNCPKVPCDSLVSLRVIDTDSKICTGKVDMHRDWDSPRTEIRVWTIDKWETEDNPVPMKYEDITAEF